MLTALLRLSVKQLRFIAVSKFQFIEQLSGVLLVVLTPAYTTFGQSFARKKSLLSTDKGDFFQ